MAASELMGKTVFQHLQLDLPSASPPHPHIRNDWRLPGSDPARWARTHFVSRQRHEQRSTFRETKSTQIEGTHREPLELGLRRWEQHGVAENQSCLCSVISLLLGFREKGSIPTNFSQGLKSENNDTLWRFLKMKTFISVFSIVIKGHTSSALRSCKTGNACKCYMWLCASFS